MFFLPHSFMPRVSILYFALVLFLGLSNSRAQQLNYSFNHINHNTGLSETMNAYVFKDSYGFIWISSNDGLNRFDGKKVIQYRTTNDSTSLKGKVINSNFFEDEDANIWFCTYDAINCYQRKTDDFKSFHINTKEGQPIKVDYYGFYLDDQKRFWFTNNNGLYLLNTKNNKYSYAGFLSANRCVVQKINAENYVVYAFTYGQNNIKKHQFKKDKLLRVPFFEKSKKELSFKNIYCINIDNDSVLWMGCNEGLVKINNVNESFIVFDSYDKTTVNEVRGIASNNLNVFTSTSNGLLLFDKSQNRFTSQIKSDPTNPYSLTLNTLFDLYLDYENILWVSIWNKGIDYANVNKASFQVILNKNKSGIENSKIDYRAVTIDKIGDYWFATDNGLTVTDNNFNIKKSYTATSTGNTIRSNRLTYLLYDSLQSKIWISSIGGGIDYYDEKNNRFYPVKSQPNFPEINYAYFIKKLKNGKVICSVDSGLVEISPTKSGFELSKSEYLKNTKGLIDSYSIAETSNGLLLVANRNKYITVFKITPSGLKPLVELDINATVVQFCEDVRTKTVWITTGNGLIKLNTENLKFNYVKNIKDIDGEYLYSILPDNDYLWIGSGKGIVKFNTKSLSTRTYNANDGVAILDFWDFCSHKLPDQRFLMGGSGGVNVFNPRTVIADTVKSQLQLISLKVNDLVYETPVSLSVLNKLNLDYNQNTFSFEFADLHLSNTGHNHFQYRIAELDSNWVDNGFNNFARFAQLNDGSYTFQVRAANADGIWSKPLALNIIISPPWYKTWWAYLLYVITFISVIVSITISIINKKLQKQKVIIEKQQAVEAERTRISAEMHDDLGASLSTMKLMCEVVKSKLESTDSTEEIDFISHTSNDLVYKMREIIWSMNSKYDSLDDLIRYVEKYTKEYLEISNIELEMVVPEFIPQLTLYGEMRRNIFLVIKETLHNTFKHAKAKKVIVTFSISVKDPKFTLVQVSIHDNGVGINLEAIHRFGNGLDNMKKRMESVNGTYTITNENGTVTTLTVKLENNKA